MAALRTHPQLVRLAMTVRAHKASEAVAGTATRAGVAILIRHGAGNDPEVFFIQRSEYEGDPWSGQIAFPGGREELGDPSLYDTATRETHEETGFDLRTNGELLGALDDLRPQTVRLPAVVVRPFVVLVGDLPEPVLSHEVAACFWVPLHLLLDSAFWRQTIVRAGGREMQRRAFHFEGFVIWGMTERILSGLLGFVQHGEQHR